MPLDSSPSSPYSRLGRLGKICLTAGRLLSERRPMAAIETLRTAALIEQGHVPFVTSRIFVRPTIQPYMVHQDRMSADIQDQAHDACYDFVLRHKSIPDDPRFKSDLYALANEENVQGLLMGISPSIRRGQTLDTFSGYQSWTKPSAVVASHTLQVACTVYGLCWPHVADRDAVARRVATAHHYLGKSLFILDRYDEARTHSGCLFRRATRWIGPPLCRRGVDAAFTYLDAYRNRTPRRTLELLIQEAQAHLSHDETDKYHVARGSPMVKLLARSAGPSF
ncbi:hypothetical protein C8R45DRAFT_562436 [Mycena sanguinolenta]|nr:hypothetical protein C8R45DRAFT_562436 [Mycena sanguinolenta]